MSSGIPEGGILILICRIRIRLLTTKNFNHRLNAPSGQDWPHGLSCRLRSLLCDIAAAFRPEAIFCDAHRLIGLVVGWRELAG